jgi:MFS family permease
VSNAAAARRLGLVARVPSFRLLFLATLGSGFGTWLAFIGLAIDVKDRTDSGAWVSALLIADVLPAVVIGLLAGPLVDRLSRKGLMIGADLLRAAIFALLPFAGSAGVIVALAALAGVGTGLFRPAVYAGLPNLVPDDELANANALLQGIENLAWMVGPVIGGAILAISSPDVAYWINAATFLVSVLLLLRIPARRLRSEEPLTRGHWHDLADGFRVVRRSRALLTVFVVWNIVFVGTAAVNVAEVVVAKVSLDSGNVGFGLLVGASGLGLTLGSLWASAALDRVGMRRLYSGSIAVMGVFFFAAAISPTVWVAAAFVVVAAAGNGCALVCNALLVQRGAPDRVRGRAFTIIMSSNYALSGLAMAVAGPLTDAFGGRWMWAGAGLVFLAGSAVAFVMARRLGPAEFGQAGLSVVEPLPEPQRAAAH